MALLLLGMSVASWVVILWKVWLLPRARTDVARSVAAFWQSASLADARQRLSPFDREALVLPLIAATRAEASGTLAAAIDRVAGLVGEALIMTAAGLAVAIPAVLAYNIFGRQIGRIEAELEGFARDLRELLANHDGVAR